MAVIPENSAIRGRGVRWAMLGTAAAVVAADQVSKSLVLRSHPIAGPGLVTVDLVRNTGASGGIAAGYPVLVTLAAIAIACVAGALAIRASARWVAIFLAAVLGGALGNLSDRIFRSPGFGRGGSFNVSDLAIQLGVIGAIVAMFVADRSRKARPQPAE
jgi:signal peptidase II